jgi:FixJ family two-component response regulator
MWHMAEQSSRGEIFVVDDDPAVRDTLSMVLKAAGYEVICFADGAALLSVARNRTPAAILLDVHIPGKSGLDILKELQGEDYPAPIFMISGQGDITMAVGAIKSGALDFIEKPFRGSEIVGRLDEAIGAYARRLAEIRLAAFPRTRAADAQGARGARAVCFRRVQQGSRSHARHQPAHDRGSPRQHHEEARRAQRRRSDPHRDDRGPARVVGVGSLSCPGRGAS